MFETLLSALHQTLTLQNVGAVFIGVIIGDVFAAIPGMEAVQAMAILLPLLALQWATHRARQGWAEPGRR